MIKIIGQRIRDAIEAKGMTQAEVATRVKVDITQVNRWVNGKAIPGADMLMALARELEVSMDFLGGLVSETNAHVERIDLSPAKQRLLDAYDRGDFQRLLYLLGTDEEFASKVKEQTHVTSEEPSIQNESVSDR